MVRRAIFHNSSYEMRLAVGDAASVVIGLDSGTGKNKKGKSGRPKSPETITVEEAAEAAKRAKLNGQKKTVAQKNTAVKKSRAKKFKNKDKRVKLASGKIVYETKPRFSR